MKKHLRDAKFGGIKIIQTVFGDLHEIQKVQIFKEGYGEGGFIVINAAKVLD